MKKFFAKELPVIFIIFVLLGAGTVSDAKIFKKDKQKNSAKVEKPKTEKKQEIEELTPPVPFEGILSQETYKISSINPVAGVSVSGNFYPGGRGANQLVVYTPQNGARTGTNEFGAEAIVVDNTVVQISGADSIIPKDGFVISGHGRAKDWMNKNLTVGSKIYVDLKNMMITAYLTNDSFIFATKAKIKEIDNVMRYYKDNDIYYDDSLAHDYITKALDNLKRANRNPDDTQKYSSMAINAANKAMQYALPYYKNEFKGVWLRPTEKSRGEISRTLDKVKKYGIETVFLETYYQGKTIFPSETFAKYNVQTQRPEFSGFDPLEIWIEEAHKRGIKVYIWFETFYAGPENPMNNPTNVISVYPKWANTTKMKYNSPAPVASISEHNGYFVDPANPEVQTYLLTLLEEIITRYKPDGINLDYIRYPQSISAKFTGYEMSNWGYTEFARNEFKSVMGIDPIDVKYGTPQWEAWAKYRQNKISSFVFKAKRITKKYNIPLTAVIFPDLNNSKEVKMQDWKTWSDNGSVDAFTPLILTCDKDTAAYLISDIKQNSKPTTKIYPGLFVAFMNGNPDDLLRQLHETRKLKTAGIVLFDFAHLDKKYTEVLLTNAFTPSTPSQTTLSQKSEPTGKNKKKKRFLFFNRKEEMTKAPSQNLAKAQTQQIKSKPKNKNIKTGSLKSVKNKG